MREGGGESHDNSRETDDLAEPLRLLGGAVGAVEREGETVRERELICKSKYFITILTNKL